MGWASRVKPGQSRFNGTKAEKIMILGELPPRSGDQINILLYIPVSKDIELLKISSEDQGGSWMVGAKFVIAPGDQKRLREWLLD